MKKIKITELSGAFSRYEVDDSQLDQFILDIPKLGHGKAERWERYEVEGRVLETREVTENQPMISIDPETEEVISTDNFVTVTEYKISADFTVEITDITSELQLAKIRAERDAILLSTDKFMLIDYPITAEQKQQYIDYRAMLRDLPAQPVLPEKVPTLEEFLAQ